MNPSQHKTKLDELLTGAVDLRPQPDFAAWRRKHPEAVDALRSLPTIIAKRRSTMTRIVRYSTSAAAILLFLAAGAWWMLFGQGTKNAWAEVMDQLAQVRTATCQLHVQRGGHDQVSKTYLEGSRVRMEDSGEIRVLDFLEGKVLWANTSLKLARIEDMKKDSGGLIVLGSNPLTDLVQMKNAPAERLPDETIGDTLCQVYRVKDTPFMGLKVPWVKLWLDPHSKLPVQIHSVVADGQMAWTFTDFHWNEPFDKDMMQLAAPKGYKLVEPPEEAKRSEAPAVRSTGTTQAGTSTEAGREIPIDEIAKTLDMLGKQIEANYNAIHTWSGTFDLVERYRFTNPNNPQYQQVSHAVGEFFAEPGRDRIRIDFQDVEPIRIIGGNVMPADPAPQQSRWIRTPEHLLRFPLTKLQHNIEGFPRIEGLPPGQPFRVLYREPPKAGRNCLQLEHSDPLSFFGDGGKPSWKVCSMYAGVLRGEKGPDLRKYAEKNMTLRRHRKGADTEYVTTSIGYGGIVTENVFSSEAGFNLVSQKILTQGQPIQTRQYTFRKENGVFIPSGFEFKRYEDQSTKDSNRIPTQHHVFILTKTQVNEPIDPAVFEIQSLGLRDGDRLVDWIENRMEVFDGKQFVPAEKFKLQPELLPDVKESRPPTRPMPPITRPAAK